MSIYTDSSARDGRLAPLLGLSSLYALVRQRRRQPAVQSTELLQLLLLHTSAVCERKLVKVLLVFGVNVRKMKGKRPALAAENELIRSSAAVRSVPSVDRILRYYMPSTYRGFYCFRQVF